MKSIVLLNCYFGEYPNYFNLFLDSCRANPTVNFLLFTDNEIVDIPDNVTLIHTTFNDIKAKIQDKFDFNISLDAPYKLCDYKPIYGFIFEEYISKYDFWGYCDVDMIFGNIRHFLTEDKLEQYDKFYKLGHLTVFRNTKDINIAFLKDPKERYKAAFTTKKITVYDEYQGIQKVFDEQGFSTYFARDYADITTAKNRFTLSDRLVDDCENNNFENQVFVRENDCIYRYYESNGSIGREEFSYIHLQKRKFKTAINLTEDYYITFNGFIPKNEESIGVAIIQKYNGIDYKKELVMRYRRCTFKIKRRINKLRLSFYESFAFTVNR